MEGTGMALAGKKQSLTKRQREVYEFLRDKIMNRGYGPTVREIGTHFNIRSPNGVMCHLKALERKGLIIREQNMSRAIQLADGGQDRFNLGLLGIAASGVPFRPGNSPDETVSLGGLFDGGDLACIRISGSGFLSLNISDGDILVINRQVEPVVGTTIAVLDDRNSLVLCSIQPGSGQLVSALHGGIAITPRQIQGVVAGVVRRFAMPQPSPIQEPV
jgi:repressor LexA